MPNFVPMGQTFRRYGRFSIFKLAAVRHFGLVVGAYAYLGLPVADILISSVNVVSGAGVS